MLSLSAAFISCSQDDVLPDGVADGTEITTTVTVKAPEVLESRAVPGIYGYDTTDPTKVYKYSGTSGMPSFGNVDLGQHPLSYTVGIYVEKTVAGATEPTYILVEKQSQVGVKASEAYFNFRLIKGQTYRIVAYADFSSKAKDNLEDITVAPTDALNDELADAFFASENFVADEHLGTILKRPFAKLRLVAHDLDRFSVGELLEITDIEVKYKGQPMLAVNSFNALSGDFNYDADATAEHTVTAKPVSYAKEYNDKDSITEAGAAVFTMYLPANFGTPTTEDLGHGESINGEVAIPQSWMYPFDVTVSYKNKKGETKTIDRSFEFDIPVKRNWLTTVDVKNFWTDNTGVTVSVNPDFEGFINATPNTRLVETEEDLMAAVSAIENSVERVGTIVLGKDIAIKGGYGIRLGYYQSSKTDYKLSPVKPMTLYLDLNGHKLSAGPGDDLKYSHGLINIYGPHTLVIDDTSEEDDGVIESTYWQTIISWRYGANIIIDGGTILSHEGAEAVYLADPLPYVGSYVYAPGEEGYNDKYLDGKPSTLTINGGCFESIDAIYKKETDKCLINLFNGGSGWPAHPLVAPQKAIGYGNVHINGGSFVEFDPAKGDNISGNAMNTWVDTDKYKVLTSTVNGKTVYTVVHKDYNGNTPELWHDHDKQ